jgi:SAM-dependent methyltransferase
MVRDTDADWQRVAQENPYWGVLSEEDYRGDALSTAAEERFFATGEKYVGDVLGFINRHLVPDFRPDRALDFGCGVGRLLIPIAKVSREAVGVDAAPRMLDLARAHIDRHRLGNVELVRGDDTLSGVRGRFNFVNTFIVLQHIPPERGTALLRRLLNLLEVGGVFSIHMTYAKARRFFMHESPRALYYRREGKQIVDLIRDEAEHPEGVITMFDYDLNEVVLSIARVSGSPVMLLPTEHDGHMGVHLIGLKAREA